GQREQERVVVQAAPRRALQVLHGFAEGREGVGLHRKAQHASAWRWGRERVGSLSRSFVCDERLELAQGLAASCVEPAGLGVGERHARELARSAPAENAAFECLREAGERLERLRDAQLFLTRARLVSEERLDVLREAAVAEVEVRRRAPGVQ